MSKGIEAKNLTAQIQYRAAGNPPSTLANAAVSNCYPGLEMDVRNVWRRLFAGIVLHEASNFVIGVDDDAPPEVQSLVNGYRLIQVETEPVMFPVSGPMTPGGPVEPLKDWSGDTRTAIEWSNALVRIAARFAGQSVACVFESVDGKPNVTCGLLVRHLLEDGAIARDIAPAGGLTESLCSPWQYDYRQCACFYWAASRPDYVNVRPRPDGTSAGNNWVEKNRKGDSPPLYINDDSLDPRLITIPELTSHWERSLRFVKNGADEPPVPDEPEPDR
jgi:hypothetical protein